MPALRHAAPLLALTSLLVALALASCSGSATSSATATIGASGGSLALADQGLRLDIPAGALSSDTGVALRATSSPGALVVSIEPAELLLARAATLNAQFQGAVHVSDVSELRGATSTPLGIDLRLESASGAQVRMRLGHFAQVRFEVEASWDGGTKTCCGEGCERDDDDRRDGGMTGDHGDGGSGEDGGHGDDHGGGGDCDGGLPDSHPDGGIPSAGNCPSGFECDDGVCVAPGGNDEDRDHDACWDGGADGGCTRQDEDADGGVH